MHYYVLIQYVCRWPITACSCTHIMKACSFTQYIQDNGNNTTCFTVCYVHCCLHCVVLYKVKVTFYLQHLQQNLEHCTVCRSRSKKKCCLKEFCPWWLSSPMPSLWQLGPQCGWLQNRKSAKEDTLVEHFTTGYPCPSQEWIGSL